MKLRVIKYTRLRCPDEGVVGNRGAAAGLGQGLPEADQGIGSNRKEVSSPLWSWGRKVIEEIHAASVWCCCATHAPTHTSTFLCKAHPCLRRKQLQPPRSNDLLAPPRGFHGGFHPQNEWGGVYCVTGAFFLRFWLTRVCLLPNMLVFTENRTPGRIQALLRYIPGLMYFACKSEKLARITRASIR